MAQYEPYEVELQKITLINKSQASDYSNINFNELKTNINNELKKIKGDNVKLLLTCPITVSNMLIMVHIVCSHHGTH